MSDPNPKGRKPTHVVVVKEKVGEGRAQVGVGWAEEGEDGVVSIRLNPGTVLAWNDGLYIRVRPAPKPFPPARRDGA